MALFSKREPCAICGGKVKGLSVLRMKQELRSLSRPEQVIRLGDDPRETAQSAAPVDAVAEIRRCKELMDQGIRTSEAFAAKKKQLPGI